MWLQGMLSDRAGGIASIGGQVISPTNRTSAMKGTRFGALVLLLMFVSLPVMGQAGEYDNGKMWTFDYPPAEHIAATYDFTPDAAWFEKARLGALRLPNCTASFVSPYGLVMTNHHCGRGSVAQVAEEGETLLDDGFMATDLVDERPVPGLYVDQLVAIEDVTDEVYAAVNEAETDAEKASARQEAIAAAQARIEEGLGEGFVVQIINLYNGGRYSAYTFRRFDDMRLVMAPELQLGYFGGDTDNFTYPRYALDMTFFRVYVDDEPYQPDYYFEWSKTGLEEGDAIFVVGNPGSTLRLETVAQLEFRRDVQEKFLLEILNSRIGALEAYYEEEPSDGLRNQIFSLKNAQKLYGGRVKGLNDPLIMAKRRDTEDTFLADLDAKYGDQLTSDVPQPYSTLVSDLAKIQDQKREFTAEFGAFLSFFPNSSLASPTMQRAAAAVRLIQARDRGEDIAPFQSALMSVPDRGDGIDRRFFEERLNDFVAYMGEQGVLAEMDAGAVTDAVWSGSALLDMENLDVDALTMDDPALAVLAPYMASYADFQSAFAGLAGQEQELNAQHGRARFEVYGTTRPPDATFSLRIADGVVASYEYNGSKAPPFTTYHGLYNRHFSHTRAMDPTGEFRLPDRWLNAPASFDRATPVNFVSTNDIIGGNSGSPVLNENLEVVGLVFDGNIESLPSAFIYQTEVSRTVSVDARGMLEALDHVYDMDRVVLELTDHILIATEAEADAR